MTARLSRPRKMPLTLLFGVLLLGCGGGGGAPPPPPGGEPPFEPPPGLDIRLDTDPLGAELSIFPQICHDGDRVYVVWYDRRDADMDVYFNRSLDGGATWLTDDVRLDTDAPGAAGSNVPRICCAGDAVYVVWSDQRAGPSQIRFNRSLDAGTTWLTDDVRLDRDDPDPASSFEPRICCDGPHVYVAWRDLRNGLPDVYFNASTDGGTTWLAEDVRIDTDPAGTGDSAPPRICCDYLSVYVVWQDDRSGAADIRFNRSLDGGDSWLTDDVRLDTDPVGESESLVPALCCDGARVYAAWHDERDGAADVRFNRSLDAGASWLLADRRLDTDGPGVAASRFVSLDCDGDAVYAVWEDGRDGRVDVRFSRSTDAGASWLVDDVRLDTDPPGTANSFATEIRCDGPELHVTWQDDREGLFDVLLTRSSDGGQSWRDLEIRLDTDPAGAAASVAPVVGAEGAVSRVVWYDTRDGPGDVYFNRAGP